MNTEADAPIDSVPSLITPLLMSARPATVDSSVVFPTPLRPSTASVSPGGSSNDTSVMTCVAPHPELTRSHIRETRLLPFFPSAMSPMPQVDVADEAIRCNLLRVALDHDLSRDKHADPLRKPRNQFHVVLNEKHRNVRRQPLDQLKDGMRIPGGTPAAGSSKRRTDGRNARAIAISTSR